MLYEILVVMETDKYRHAKLKIAWANKIEVEVGLI
jgi:hypothetical protein